MITPYSANPEFCGIVLAGGRSSRMGRDKSELLLEGRTFLEVQINKLHNLRAGDIIVSGKSSSIRHTRYVMDLIPGCGPLGGLYSCFLECRQKYALVLSVDVPLITESTLQGLLNAHIGSDYAATVLSHGGRQEPLIAVYNTDTTDLLKDLIDKRKLALRAFLDRLDCQYYEFTGDPDELLNCNSPDDLNLLRTHS